MKRTIYLSFIILFIFSQLPCVFATTTGGSGGTTVLSTNNVTSLNSQTMQGQGYGYGYSSSQTGDSSAIAVNGDSISEGGDSYSDADSLAYSEGSDSVAYISTNSTSNYESRTPPVSMLPPYLPTFAHGGWGTVQGYFPNGPTTHNQMYERAFYPGSKLDMKELKGVINSIPYDGPIGLLGGILNGVGTIFGGPDNFHHGKGFEIANSIVRQRRPKNMPLYIMIDSNISRDYLRETGYTYVGKISLEGKTELNWDQVYKAAIAEALPWDVDIMLVSGGMKGVTIGTTTTFPSAAGAYAQTNYSLTLLGGKSTGVTEGKGEAMVSCECYRYNPQAAQRRTIPDEFYKRIHVNTVANNNVEKIPQIQTIVQPAPAQASLRAETPVRAEAQVRTEPQTNVYQQVEPQLQANLQPQAQAQIPMKQQPYQGVNVSQELYNMAGF